MVNQTQLQARTKQRLQIFASQAVQLRNALHGRALPGCGLWGNRLRCGDSSVDHELPAFGRKKTPLFWFDNLSSFSCLVCSLHLWFARTNLSLSYWELVKLRHDAICLWEREWRNGKFLWWVPNFWDNISALRMLRQSEPWDLSHK